MIDGMDNNERAIGTIGVRPSVEAIAEVRVQTNLYTAEVGRTAGGVINILTKSGTNEVRGSAYEFFRNEAFDARNFFASTGPKPKLRQNQFGGSLGGPIVKDRTFFFVDYEGFRLTQGLTFVSTVPTERMRNGDFSELLAGPNPVVIYDPATSPRTPFPGNLIPLDRLDPVSRRYLALYPRPTRAGLANNFATTLDKTQESDTFDVRIDHRFTERDVFYARYSFNDVTTFTPGTLPEVDGVQPGGALGNFAGDALARAHGLHLNYVRMMGPRLLLEMKAGYLRTSIQSLPLNYGQNLSQEFGLSGVNVDEQTSALAPMVPAGYASVGDGIFIPLIQLDDTFQYNVTLTHTRGSHNIKAGAGLIRRGFTVFQSNSPVGNFSFTSALTNNGAGTGGNSLASLFLGYPSQVTRIVSLVRPRYRTWEPGLFVQDDWRATRWLTLNLGLRHDVFTPFTEAEGRIANLDLDTAQILMAGVDGVSSTAGQPTDWSNVAPRVGFAATLGRGMVLRGGWGLSYYPGNYTSNSFLKNPPFVSTYGPAVSAGTSGGLPTLRLADGLPLPVATDPTSPRGTILAVDRDFRSTRVQQFNLTLEKAFGANVLSVGYVGARGAHEARQINNLNLAPPGPGDIQSRRPYALRLPNVSTIQVLTSDGHSWYDAFQASFQRRYHGGLTVNANYTLGHAINDFANPGNGAGATGVVPSLMDVIDRGPADHDVRHRAVLALNYQVPFARSATGRRRQLLAGWQLNAVGFWQTGLPFTVTNATPRTNTGVGANGDRPDRIGTGTLANPTLQKWFDTSAFLPQALNTLGNAGRNVLYGPPQRRLDVSVFKDFFLRGDQRVQLRAECFNLTNTPSFANPNGSLGAPAFGTISSTGNAQPRQLQFALKYLF
jgi:hypothetical protein